MGKNQENPLATERKESLPEKEVWLVDDNRMLSEPTLELWRMVKPGYYNFRYFDTAKEAVGELKKRGQVGAGLPQIIFVDGNLGGDEGELRSGENVVKIIRSMEENEHIKIIARSSSDRSLEEMKGVGADMSFSPSDDEEIRRFLSDPDGYKKEDRYKNF